MGPDGHGAGARRRWPQFVHPLGRQPQLGLGAAPKEIGGGRGQDQIIGGEGAHPPAGFRRRQLFQMGIEQQGLVSGRFQLLARKEQLQRQVGVRTAEVGRAVKIPSRLHQSELHRRASNSSSRTGPRACGSGAQTQVSGAGWASSDMPLVRSMASAAVGVGIDQLVGAPA